MGIEASVPPPLYWMGRNSVRYAGCHAHLGEERARAPRRGPHHFADFFLSGGTHVLVPCLACVRGFPAAEKPRTLPAACFSLTRRARGRSVLSPAGIGEAELAARFRAVDWRIPGTYGPGSYRTTYMNPTVGTVSGAPRCLYILSLSLGLPPSLRPSSHRSFQVVAYFSAEITADRA